MACSGAWSGRRGASGGSDDVVVVVVGPGWGLMVVGFDGRGLLVKDGFVVWCCCCWLGPGVVSEKDQLNKLILYD
jgi:hypothetical protein